MKKIIFLSAFLLLFACKEESENTEAVEAASSEAVESINPNFEELRDNSEELKANYELLEALTKESTKANAISNELFFNNLELGFTAVKNELPSEFVKVNIQNELVKLFDPDNFKCNCADKLKKKLKSFKNSNNNAQGFVPDIVWENITDIDAYKISGSGSNILANGFSYVNEKGVRSIFNYVKYSPTANNFNEADYFELDENTKSNFFYTLDCTGYLSASMVVAGGIAEADIKTSAKNANEIDNSLVVIYGVMYSPLYQAYKGEGEFALREKNIIKKRIDVLKAILSKIPNFDYNPKTIIELNADYKVMFTSNTGKSSFNGKGQISGKGNFGFGFGSVRASSNIGGSISRKSEFYKYDSYVLDKNILTTPDKISIETIEKLIEELEKIYKKY